MTNARIHAIDSLRTQSLLPIEYDTKSEQIGENPVVICQPSSNLKSILKKKQLSSSPRKKKLQFIDSKNKIFIVENWKIYNLPYEDDDTCCCQIS